MHRVYCLAWPLSFSNFGFVSCGVIYDFDWINVIFSNKKSLVFPCYRKKKLTLILENEIENIFTK
jgi:hypothetical protein